MASTREFDKQTLEIRAQKFKVAITNNYPTVLISYINVMEKTLNIMDKRIAREVNRIEKNSVQVVTSKSHTEKINLQGQNKSGMEL